MFFSLYEIFVAAFFIYGVFCAFAESGSIIRKIMHTARKIDKEGSERYNIDGK